MVLFIETGSTVQIVRLCLWNKRRKRDSNRTVNGIRSRIWITLIDRKRHCFNAELTHKCSTSYSNKDGWPKIAEVDGLTPFQMPYPHLSIHIFVKPSKQSYMSSLSPKKIMRKDATILSSKEWLCLRTLIGPFSIQCFAVCSSNEVLLFLFVCARRISRLIWLFYILCKLAQFN